MNLQDVIFIYKCVTPRSQLCKSVENWIYKINNEILCKAQKYFKEQFVWWDIDYDFPNGKEKSKYIDSGAYIKGNSLISSFDKWHNKIFLAVPRLKTGIPSTLNYIDITDVYTKAPYLKPYPSWDFHENTNKTSKGKKMVSVISVYIDKCNRLWALDTGIVEELKFKKVELPPSLHIFNLNNDKLLRRYTLNDEDYKSDSRFTNIVVENSHGNCEFSYAYLADSKNGLVVYNWDSNKSYLIKHNYFSFEPIWGILKTSEGRLIQVDNGIQGMALLMMDLEGYRKLFFNPMAGINEFSVSTKTLQNKTRATNSITDFKFEGERGLNSQSSASVYDQETGVLFYTAFTKNCIMCWNSFRGVEFSADQHGVVDQFQTVAGSYLADIKLDSNGMLWVLTNDLIDFLYEKNYSKIPYRLFTGISRQIIKGTPCRPL